MTDQQIISLFQARDEKAVSALSDKYRRTILNVARSHLHSPEDAEECTNDVMLKLWQSIPPAEPNSLEAFIVTVTQRMAINMAERQQAKKRGGGEAELALEELDECLADRYDLEKESEDRELSRAIDAFVGTLTVSAPLTICFHCPQAISPVIQDTFIESIGLHYQDQMRHVERFMENRFIRYIVLIIFSITALRVITLLPDKAEQSIMWVVFSNFAAFSLWQIGSTYYERAEAFEKLTQLTIIKESKMVFLCREG